MSFESKPSGPTLVSHVPEDDPIFVRVRSILMDALGAGEDAVYNGAFLDGLGAESIDHLDISHRLNGEFKITLPKEPLPLTVQGLVALVRRTAEAQL